MSKIDELINKYCPDGVEYKELGEVVEYIRGITYKKTDEILSTNGHKVLRANNITLSSNTINYNDIKYISKNVKIKEAQKLKKDDILICAASGSKEHIGKVAYIYQDMDYSFGGFMSVLRVKGKISSRFLFHLLIGKTFYNYLNFALNTTTINNLSSTIMNKFPIPIPPLPIQEEIVKILDSFTELEQELEQELELRKKQYEYYRNELLTFGDEVEWKTLGEVGAIFDGTHQTPKYTTSGIKFVSVENIKSLYTSKKFISKLDYDKLYKIKPRLNDLFMTRIGSIGVCSVIDKEEDLAYYVTLTLIRPNLNIVISKFLKYIIESSIGQRELLKRTLVNATPIKINLGEVGKITIPIPPIAEQERIVTILDKFDALVNDISIGLPAEIEARRKQYEYYRDKLLTFKKQES